MAVDRNLLSISMSSLNKYDENGTIGWVGGFGILLSILLWWGSFFNIWIYLHLSMKTMNYVLIPWTALKYSCMPVYR